MLILVILLILIILWRSQDLRAGPGLAARRWWAAPGAPQLSQDLFFLLLVFMVIFSFLLVCLHVHYVIVFQCYVT